MALFKKPHSVFWWYDIRFNGKRYRASTGQRTKSAAGTVESAVLTRLNEGAPAPSRSAKSPTLREFSERFLRWSDNSHAIKPSTKRFYRYGVRLLLYTPLADLLVDQITNELVECTRFMRPLYDRRARAVTDARIECKPVYVNQALRTLKAMFGKGLEWKVVRDRPRFSTLHVASRDRLIDTDTEIRLQQVLEAPSQRRHERLRKQTWLVMVILQDTGMRPDEVFPMRIENLHFAERRIWVPTGKTRKARRFVTMSERMHMLLTEWCWQREGWVFPSKRSKSGHLETIAKGFQAARLRAGIDGAIVPYSARHTYGTYQMEATGNVFAVSAQMGHAGVKSMEPYQHPDIRALNNSIDKRNRKRDLRSFELKTLGHTFGHTSDRIN